MLVYALTSRPLLLSIAIGAPLVIIGTLVRLYASGFVMKNKELATHGPYALVRHPLYTGNIVSIVGLAIAGATLWGVPLALVFFWFYYPPAIEYEDRKLRRLFGQQWEQWSSATPALVPRFANVGRMRGGSWSFAKSMRQNGEGIIAVYILVCLWITIARLP
jgi:protein-S-isoprenylcysteine O-methyltransferase Ste14